jgi:hypothetical protein
MKTRVTLIFLFMTILLTCARQAEHCWVCQREIHPSVRAVVTLADGKRITACCPRCALHYREEPGNSVRSITVSDYGGGRPLPLQKAFLVEGSDVTPCVHHGPMTDASGQPMEVCFDRCMPSLIAFRDAGQARSFMADHGGQIFAPGTFPGITSGRH